MRNAEVTITQGENKVVLKGQDIANLFHQIYYNSGVWRQTYYFGHQILKCPLDMWIYQELITQIKPDVIIETGTYRGASALYMAHLCDLIGNGEIITIDIEAHENQPKHPRIRYMIGSSLEPVIIDQVKEFIKNKSKVMVVLDSDHTMQHVAQELKLFGPMVTPGSYLIVEDSNINGHPVRSDYGPGPLEAIADFVRENKEFMVDYEREKFFVTYNPCGYLKKVEL